jgi:Arylsulfotransferase (ASST)
LTRVAVLLATAGATGFLLACGSAQQASSQGAPAAASVAAAAANPITVSPLPGTEDASPSSQISFLGAQGTRVEDVRVVGSSSGAHAGQLRAYAMGNGESFLPRHTFVAGERVTVKASVSAGGPRQTVSTSFMVAHQAAVDEQEFAQQPGDPHAVQHYRSAPQLTPSTVKITTAAKAGATPGDLFMAPYQGQGSPGPMIAEQDGQLVWFHPLPKGEQATNFQVQSYEGRPVLTWWQGRIIRVGFGQGEDVLYDSSYRQVAAIRAGNGYHADLHELRLTPQGTAWIDAFDPIHMSLSAEHGSAHGILTDSVIQEIDVKTGLVMWEWHALGHIPLAESHNAVPRTGYPWDYVHINSIDPGSSGDVLLSSRNTWALYDVDIHSGGQRWRVGGDRPSFKAGAGTHFYWQHDAEFQRDGDISLFDNGSDPPKEHQSRGLLLHIDTTRRQVTLSKQLINPSRTLLASSQGNTLALPAGKWLLGYGGLPDFTEFDAAGQVLLDGTLGSEVQDFRTYLAPWSAQPLTAPAIAVATTAATTTVWASWNGATRVASWRVLGGAAPGALNAVGAGTRSGFETALHVAATEPYVAVQALDASGTVLGTSAVVRG